MGEREHFELSIMTAEIMHALLEDDYRVIENRSGRSGLSGV